MGILKEIVSNPELTLVRTSERMLDESTAQLLFSKGALKDQVKSTVKCLHHSACVALHVNAYDVCTIMAEMVQDSISRKPTPLYISPSPKAAEHELRIFFEPQDEGYTFDGKKAGTTFADIGDAVAPTTSNGDKFELTI
eukprot:GFYU01009015.1.p1 GENE.GFYU01009015.1~~GFYU01009015.1.p1  ORF type:complete len:139 (+),score=39.83 GFYU01009015.1:26-442(+)